MCMNDNGVRVSTPKKLYLFWLIYLLPIAIPLGEVGAKPVDLAISDVFGLLSPILLISNSLPGRYGWALASLLYFPLIGLVGAFSAGGDASNLLSAMSFSLVLFQIPMGGILFRRYGVDIFKPIPVVFSVIVATLLISDLVLGSFPRGCAVEGRWGGCFFGLDVYGFVNSSAGYMAVMAGSLTASLFVKMSRWKKAFFIVALASLVFTIPMSLSRSATVTIIIVIFVAFFALSKLLALSMAVISIFILQVALPFMADSVVGRGLASRIYIGLDRGDIASGRFQIWYETLALIEDAPLFGHKFGYFSEFSYFGTAHNQYLEIIFKAGFIGLIIYMGFLSYIVLRFVRVSDEIGLNSRVVIAVMGAIIALMANSLSQPLMNYSVMGNVIFLLAGMVMAIPLRGRQ